MFNLIDKASGIGLLALAALPMMSLTAAHAQTATVKISDLDLRQAAQAAVFEQRLDRAANKVCNGRVTFHDLRALSVCKGAVRAEAMDKLAAHDQSAARAVQLASR